MMDNQPVQIESVIKAPVQKVWTYFTLPEHIVQWSYASEDWHTPSAENDLRVGGIFKSRMEAKDGSFGFDFWGTYDQVKPQELIEYTLGDARKVSIRFSESDGSTRLVEIFDAEQTNPVEMQKAGWQAILDNFRKYVELQD